MAAGMIAKALLAWLAISFIAALIMGRLFAVGARGDVSDELARQITDGDSFPASLLTESRKLGGRSALAVLDQHSVSNPLSLDPQGSVEHPL